MPSFPDAELVLMDYLADFGYCVTSTPANLAERLPVLRIQRVGGNDDGSTDFPQMDVQTFAAVDYQNPRASHALTSDVRTRLLDTAGEWVTGPMLTDAGLPGALLDGAATSAGPLEYPWPTSGIQVVRTIYTLTIRR